MDNKQNYFSSLKNITAADGRHCLITEPLREYFSEHALHKYRLLVELKHLVKMSDMGQFGLRRLDDIEKKELMKLFQDFSEADSCAIAEYDHFGRNGIGATEHDVKSVELYIRERLKGTKLEYLLPMIHFGFTSEDVSHIAYNCMIKGAVDSVWMPELVKLCDRLRQLAIENKDVPMLSRTHGQPASTTTFGKEMAVYLKRFANELKDLKELKLNAKMNGAVGNYNAHIVGYSEIDWITYSKEFAEEFGFEFELLTNQRGPKNRVVKLFQNIMRLNTILKDLDIDMWIYVSKDLVLQQKVESHIGSSVMPHKINPWLIECSEGNTEVSNALFEVFCRELEVSRLQRDLSDHDLERNYGAAFAYSLVALKYTNDFLNRISINSSLMLSELKENSQVLSEAYQTILRAKGRPEAYNMFKDIFRDNVKFDEIRLNEVIQLLDIDENTKKQLMTLRAENYLGETSKLVDIAVKYYDDINVKIEQNMLPITGKSTVLIGTQYGDEGKGRILDTLLGNGQYKICARHNGGANAGHTIQVGDKKIALHQVPSAVFYPDVMLYIGSGCVINPIKLVEEIKQIETLGLNVKGRFFISGNATLIQPHHILFDKLYCQKPLGTTANGIGPAYADLAIRMVQEGDNKRLKSVRFGDYLAMSEKYQDVVRQNLIEALFSSKLLYNLEYSPELVQKMLIELDSAIKELQQYWSKDPLTIEKFVASGKNVFFEGAQSVMLDVLYGTYPCVTSSRCVAAAAYTGGDLSMNYHHETIGVVKAIMSRVGVGPFVSELGGKKSEEYWTLHQNDAEFNQIEKMNDIGELLQSEDLSKVNIAIRVLSGEYGASTRRPRRIGMLDLVALNQVCKMNGVDKLYINKVDDLHLYSKTKLLGIPVVVAYELDGQRIDYMPTSIEELSRAKPVVEYLPHIPEISSIKQYAQLPESVKNLLSFIESKVGTPIYGIGVGPEREQFVEIKK